MGPLTVHPYLRRVEVLRPICVLLEQLTATMTEQLMVGNLQLERARVPSVVQVNVVGMDKRQLLVYPQNIA